MAFKTWVVTTFPSSGSSATEMLRQLEHTASHGSRVNTLRCLLLRVHSPRCHEHDALLPKLTLEEFKKNRHLLLPGDTLLRGRVLFRLSTLSDDLTVLSQEPAANTGAKVEDFFKGLYNRRYCWHSCSKWCGPFRLFF